MGQRQSAASSSSVEQTAGLQAGVRSTTAVNHMVFEPLGTVVQLRDVWSERASFNHRGRVQTAASGSVHSAGHCP